ncbi:hypothetical protein [Salinivibrio socompensis]|uniref:hypothetical protein n=1 Tax=Salinivibrio socompensis TaxID=1510206 RepID=UPI0004BC470B|nr:hypothetical protein [Salinivibrio socompensis]
MSSLLKNLDHAVVQLGQASSMDKPREQFHVIDICEQVLIEEDGINALYTRIHALNVAGLFEGTDWDHPEYLLPNLVPVTLASADKAPFCWTASAN